MGRFSANCESQVALLSGAPSGTTYNGYFAAVVAGATSNFHLRRVILGVRSTGTPISQQQSIAVYRQSVRAVGATSTFVGQNLDPRGMVSTITGLDVTTGVTATTGPTLTTNPMKKFTFNTQSAFDLPFELIDEWTCDQGVANGLAFVNIGQTLPSTTLFTLDVEWEE